MPSPCASYECSFPVRHVSVRPPVAARPSRVNCTVQESNLGAVEAKNYPEDPHYRANVAVVVFNDEGSVFTCRRFWHGTGESSDDENWQFPQGGIDKGEVPLQAALRELAEETSITDVEFVAEYPGWLKYDFDNNTRAQLGEYMKKFKGQTQKYFLMRFTGDDQSINLNVNGHKQEFDKFQWSRLDEVTDRVVGFKKSVYKAVVEEFSPIIAGEIESSRSTQL